MKPFWLEKIDSVLPEIKKVVNNCDEPYRQTCFEILLTYALNSDLIQKSPEQKGPEKRYITSIEKPRIASSNSKFEKFLIDNSISHDSIDNLIDLNSGDIISTKLGKKGSDTTRIIAVLISLWHFSKEGEFSFKLTELVDKTKPYGVGCHNHKRDLRKASFEGKKVFLEDGEIWKIAIPTQGYVIKTIKELIGPVNTKE
jgi:hypothetical protein